VERLWRTVKYEEIYLKDYPGVAECRQGLEEYFPFYNRERPHQALDYRTPWEVYHGLGKAELGKQKWVLVLKGSKRGRR